ncbi:MAG: MATE family efflux transporter [Spirochaetia bacterium]|nr:MATE family efflux transporter [Spirochaetia bacterium]MDY3722814.1 MATE family efflux transporter [Treponema sp.]MDY5819456.1 MATE family efflux transporter [Treponema sp.]
MNQEAKSFYKDLRNVVQPMAIQNLISSAVNSADVIMLGYIGQTAIAASSLAGNVAFILFMISTGLSSGLVMLGAQYWGKKDTEAIKTLLGIGLRICCSVEIIVALVAAFYPRILMLIFTKNEALIAEGCRYLRAASFSYVCLSFSQMFQAGFKSIERVKIVTITSTTSLFLNIGLNAVFIFGLLGVPKMGITGVGIATSIARFIEMVICFIYAGRQTDIKFSVTCVFRRNKLLTRDFFKYSLPAVGNELVWGSAFAMYSVIMGHLGEDIVAANSVVNTVRQLGSVLCFGMAYGGAIVVGKYMGAGDMAVAERNASRLARVTIFSGVLGAVLLICLYPVLPYIADLNETAAHYRNILLFINAYSLIGASINTVLICGIFRAGGDSKFGFVADIINMWCVSVPLGLLAAFVFKLPPLWVYFILFLDEFEKMPFVIHHYFKKGWLRNITR